MWRNWKKTESDQRGARSVFMPIVYVGLLIAALIVGFSSWQAWAVRSQSLSDTQRDLTALTDASAEQLKEHIDAISHVLSASALVGSDFFQEKAADPERIIERLRTLETGSPVSSLSLIDRTGHSVLDTAVGPSVIPVEVGLSALDKITKNPLNALVLLDPAFLGLHDSVTTFAARGIFDHDGHLVGAVLTPLDLSAVSFFGKEASYHDHVMFSVRLSDNGRVVAQYPDPGAKRYLRDSSHEYVTRRLQDSMSGVIKTSETIDSVPRFFVFRRIPGYSLVSIAAMDQADIDARWHGDAYRILLIGYMSIVVVVVLLIVIHQQLRKLVSRSSDVLESEQRFDRVIKNLTDALYVRDKDGRIVVANRQFSRFFGIADERTLVGQQIADLIPHATAETMGVLTAEVTSPPDQVLRFEHDTVSATGAVVPIEFTLNAVEIAGDSYVLGQMRDMTARREYEAKLVRQASYDEITGLPNRRLYTDRLAHALHRAKRSGRMTAVMFIDLDHFKRVNDTLGHPAGDQLLIAAAARLSSLVGDADTVARFGGDEFVLLVPEIESPLHCRMLADKIVSSFQLPFNLAGRQISVTASVGVAVSPNDGSEGNVLLQHADTAMYEAKSTGRSGFVFFDHEMNLRVHETLRIDEHIRAALDNNEITLLYQPIIDPVTGKAVKAEALARWSNSVLGKVPPDKFIPVAEENGVISQIGKWVLREACRTAAGWMSTCESPITVSVNVSALQLNEPDFLLSVSEALEEFCLPPHLLELEITERTLISDDDAAIEAIASLREIGVSLSLDDFGTGYSSLSYLTRFPLNTLKIDRSFVKNLDHDPQTQNLTRAIVAMAKSLDLKLVAEGVETQEQADRLMLFGCEYLQGFYFGHPMSADELCKFRMPAVPDAPIRGV